MAENNMLQWDEVIRLHIEPDYLPGMDKAQRQKCDAVISAFFSKFEASKDGQALLSRIQQKFEGRGDMAGGAHLVISPHADFPTTTFSTGNIILNVKDGFEPQRLLEEMYYAAHPSLRVGDPDRGPEALSAQWIKAEAVVQAAAYSDKLAGLVGGLSAKFSGGWDQKPGDPKGTVFPSSSCAIPKL